MTGQMRFCPARPDTRPNCEVTAVLRCRNLLLCALPCRE